MNITLKSVPQALAQKSWVKIPLSEDIGDSIGVVKTSLGEEFEARIIRSVLYVKAALTAGSVVNGDYIPFDPQPTEQPKFILSDWISDDPSSMIPQFIAVKDQKAYYFDPMVPLIGPGPHHDNGSDGASFFLEQSNSVEMIWRFQTSTADLGIKISGTISIFTEQDYAPVNIQIECATEETTFDKIEMILREEVVVDSSVARGLTNFYLGSGEWQTRVANEPSNPDKPTIVSGAILPKSGRKLLTDTEVARAANLEARKYSRIVGE